MIRALAVVALGVVLTSCREDCVATCPLPVAVIVHVTGGVVPGPVEGVFIRTAGDRTGAGANVCRTEAPGSICTVPGHAGTYELEVGAPGFQTRAAPSTSPARHRRGAAARQSTL
jgi:hypothetical protein